MPRPTKKRKIAFDPQVTLFMPSGVRRCRMETVVLGTDEIEALRLTDLEGMYQGQAAEAMGISRQTLGNILCSARRKASEALTQGKAIQIGSGSSPVDMVSLSDYTKGCGRKSGSICQEPGGGSCSGKPGDGCGTVAGGGCGHGDEHGCRK